MKLSLTVFVSSTFTDLVSEREAVFEAIKKLQHQYDSMEFFGARSERPIETCLAEVRHSNVLVVILGHRYGSIVPGSAISFTEAEYCEGYKLGKPCLVYIRDDDVPILPKHVERDPQKIMLLEKFKETLRSRHTVATFKNSHDLAQSVGKAIKRTAQALEEAALAEEKFSQTSSMQLNEANQILKAALDKGVPAPLLVSTVRQAIIPLLSTQDGRPRVFVGYSHKDWDVVQAIVSKLELNNVAVWIDVHDIRIGEDWAQAMYKGLESADLVVFFLSKNYIDSPWSKQELALAMSGQLRKADAAAVLPILLDDVEVPALLRSVLYLDMRDRNIPRLVSTLLATIRSRTK